MNKFCLFAFSFLLLVSFSGCAQTNNEKDERLVIIKIESSELNKEMISQVYLPEGYDDNIKYPVLYFLPSYGGSSYVVINQFDITDSIDKLTQDNQIEPMIVVALGIDNSFGINSGYETKEMTTSSDKRIDEGMYEDYIINEAIPYIDENFSTDATKNGRYIGGYSMGGFAALYIAFTHPDLFSKVGGHSPSLFTGDFPDTTISEWLYPDENIRSQRDPIYLGQKNKLAGLEVFLDTDETGVNVEGCKRLYEILTEEQVDVEFNLFPGTHGFAYCRDNMNRYLLFYGNH